LVCDVVLNGADMAPILERAKRTHPKLDILVVTACAQDAVVIRAVLAGATGYILKDSQENLLTSIRLLRGGGSPVSPTVARSVLRAIHARTITQPVPPKRDSAPPTSPVGRPVHQHADDGRVLLSQRESEIIMLLAKGISFSEIGGILEVELLKREANDHGGKTNIVDARYIKPTAASLAVATKRANELRDAAPTDEGDDQEPPF
jgi:DNA-binding NarL/FixJ family response regulator